MSQQRPNGAAFERPRDAAGHDARDNGSLQDTDDKAAFDYERFPGGYYPGLILHLDRIRGRGIIRSFSGREIRFEFPFVNVVGAELGGRAPGIELLRQGDRVGFDVGWTSKGLRVTRIKPAKDG
ncbi:MAG TPA: hypothetical protein VJ728_07565 [Candidatus Binataceae bacterium]|nr:hypothetical protein [Candidatus Binataceae bacterium]